MYRATVGNVPLAGRLRAAHTHWTRLRGLLGAEPLAPGEGLWIKPSRRIHMFGMRYALDLVFMDDGGRVMRLVHALPPNRISPRVAGASSVLELPAGTLAATTLAEGDRVEIEAADATPARNRTR